MLSSFSSFRAQRLPSGVCLKSPEGRRIDVDIKDDGITLEGDGFAHSIRVEGDHIHISRLEGQGPDVTFPKLVYLEDSKRIALGVAASLTGLPVNLFIGEKPQPVYVNLASRLGMGRRRDGSREGGRYRVRKMERQANGQFDIHLKDRRVRKGPNEYHSKPTLYLKSGSGRPLEQSRSIRSVTSLGGIARIDPSATVRPPSIFGRKAARSATGPATSVRPPPSGSRPGPRSSPGSIR